MEWTDTTETGSRLAGNRIKHEVDRKQGPEHTTTVKTVYAEGGEWGEHQPLVDSLRGKLFADFPWS